MCGQPMIIIWPSLFRVASLSNILQPLSIAGFFDFSVRASLVIGILVGLGPCFCHPDSLDDPRLVGRAVTRSARFPFVWQTSSGFADELVTVRSFTTASCSSDSGGLIWVRGQEWRRRRRGSRVHPVAVA